MKMALEKGGHRGGTGGGLCDDNNNFYGRSFRMARTCVTIMRGLTTTVMSYSSIFDNLHFITFPFYVFYLLCSFSLLQINEHYQVLIIFLVFSYVISEFQH